MRCTLYLSLLHTSRGIFIDSHTTGLSTGLSIEFLTPLSLWWLKGGTKPECHSPKLSTELVEYPSLGLIAEKLTVTGAYGVETKVTARFSTKFAIMMNKPPFYRASVLHLFPSYNTVPSPNGEFILAWFGVRPVPSTDDRLFHRRLWSRQWSSGDDSVHYLG